MTLKVFTEIQLTDIAKILAQTVTKNDLTAIFRDCSLYEAETASKGALGGSDTDSILSESAKWYLQDCSSSSTRLRRCVFFTWVMIELDYSVRCIGV